MRTPSTRSKDAEDLEMDAESYGIYGFLQQLPKRAVSGIHLCCEGDVKQSILGEYFRAARLAFSSLQGSGTLCNVDLSGLSERLLRVCGLRQVHWIGMASLGIGPGGHSDCQSSSNLNRIGNVTGLDALLSTIFLRLAKPFCTYCRKVANRSDLDQILYNLQAKKDVGAIAIVVKIASDLEGVNKTGLITYLEMFDSERAWINDQIVNKFDLEPHRNGYSDGSQPGVVIMTVSLPVAVEQRLFLNQEINNLFLNGLEEISLYYLPDKRARGELIGLLTRDYNCLSCRRSYKELSLKKFYQLFGLDGYRRNCGGHENDLNDLQFCDYELYGLLLSRTASTAIEKLVKWVRKFEDHSDLVVQSAAKAVRERLTCLVNFGFQLHSLNESIDHLSLGEKVRFKLAMSVDIGISDVLVIIDRALDLLPVKEAVEYINLLKVSSSSGCNYLILSCLPEIAKLCEFFWEECGSNGGGWKKSDGLGEITETVDKGNSKNASKKDKKALSYPIKFAGEGKKFLLLPSEISVICGSSGSGKSALLCSICESFAPLTGNDDRICLEEEPGIVDASFNFAEIVFISEKLTSEVRHLTLSAFLGLSDRLAQFFAATARARLKGLIPVHFTKRSHEFLCPVCQGRGLILANDSSATGRSFVDMISEVRVECPECAGTCFQTEVLDVKVHGKTISDLLLLPAEQGLSYFGYDRTFARWLKLLSDLDLGLIRLGTFVADLSFSQLQRLRLARILYRVEYGRSKKDQAATTSRILFLLDNICYGATSGEVQSLLQLFKTLCSKGHTVVCVDNHPELLRNTRYLTELKGKWAEAAS